MENIQEMKNSLKYINGLVASNLVPTIMAISAGRAHSEGKLDILYITVTLGTIIGTVISSLNFQIRAMTRDRNRLTFMTTFLLTSSLLASIVGFHLVRHNFNPYRGYELPKNIRGQSRTRGSDVFRHHFYADFIPGIIIMSQAILTMILNHELLHRAKRKFSYGEANIVAQLVSAAYSVWAFSVYSKFTSAGPFRISQTNDIILNLAAFYSAIALVPCYLILQRSHTLVRYTLLMTAGLISLYVVNNIVSTSKIRDPFTWFLSYLFSTHQRLSLFSLWLAMTMGAVSFSTTWSRLVGQTNSYARKVFHGAISVVFMTGYLQDIQFTEFAAGGMVTVMVILEAIRSWQLWPFGGRIEQVCRALRGSWDNRYLTISHIYLLVGVMLPLWLLPADIDQDKSMLSSGLISVGIGDTFAAIIGSQFGTTYFDSLKSGKTIEGFFGNAAAMILFRLLWVGYLGFVEEFSFIMAALFTAFFELTSSDCDNLILPLIMILLQLLY